MSDDVYQELRDNREAMLEFFASKGWEILLKWAAAQVKREFEEAIRAEDAAEREAARVKGLAIEHFMRLPFFLADHAGLNNVEGASEIPQTTPEA